jgi:ligand-binding sensor domain-containing protein
MKTKIAGLLILILNGSIHILAQNNSYSFSNYRNGNEAYSIAISGSSVFIGTANGVYQRNYTGEVTDVHNTQKGLLSDRVNEIYAENDDKIWFATANGLHLFANNKYLVFDQTSGILNNYILSICSDTAGNIWLANFNGLSRYKDNQWDNFIIPFTAPDTVSFSSILSNGKLVWGSAPGYGLYSFDGSNWTNYTTSDGLQSNNLIKLQNDTSHILWMASLDSGLIERRNGWIKHYDPLLDTRVLNDFIIDNNNIKWIFTSHGVISVTGDTWIMPDSLSTFNVIKGRMDGDNNLWLITSAEVLKYNTADKQLTRFKVEGLLDNAISSILVDANNVKWICSWNGISKLRYDWSNILYNEIDSSIQHCVVTSIKQDLKNKVWMSYDYSGEGILCFDGNSWKTYKSPEDSLNAGYISTLAVDSNNYLWTSFDPGGIQFRDSNQWRSPVSTNELASKYINNIAVDRYNDIWMATSEGISKYNGLNYENYNVGKNVTGIAIDSQNKIWAGTSNVDYPGLYEFDGVNVKSYSIADGLAEQWLRTVAIDRNDNVWCGHQSMGLSMYNRKTGVWKRFNSSDGLVANQINSIAVDANNTLYIGSSDGLSIAKATIVVLKVMTEQVNLKSSESQINVPVTVQNFNKIRHLAFTLHFDNTIMKFNGLKGGELYGLSGSDMDTSAIQNGNLSIDYERKDLVCQSLNDGSTLIYLNFTVINASVDSSEIALSNITVQNFKNETLDYQKVNARFKIAGSSDMVKPLSQDCLYSVYPNPVQSKVTINCEEEMKTVMITNISGQILRIFQTGNLRSVEMDIKEFAAGIYFLRIYTSLRTINVKIVKD